MKPGYQISILTILLFVLLLSCSKQDNDPELPFLETVPVTEIKSETAVSGGFNINPGNSEILQKGICWSTEPSPTLENDFTNDGTGESNFESNLNGLLGGNIYYARSYAQSEFGIGYGNEIEFSTPVCRLKRIENPAGSTYVDLVFEYDPNNRVKAEVFTTKTGYNVTEEYTYNNQGITITTKENGLVSYEMDFSGDTLTGYRKYYASGNKDINEISYLGDTAVTMVLFKPFGPGNSLIPIDSVVYIFDDNGNIQQSIIYDTGIGTHPLEFSAIHTYVYDDLENPYKGLLTNFSVQGNYHYFIRYFNNNNQVGVISEGVTYWQWEYTSNDLNGKTTTGTNKTNNDLYKFFYENCDQ